MKTRNLIIAGCMAVILAGSGIVFGCATRDDHVFFYNQYGSPPYETINDWVKVGSPGYSQYFTLTSNTSCSANQELTESSNTRLEWYCPASIVVPDGTWCGYEWTVKPGYQEQIIRFITCGTYNIATDAKLQLTDEQNNVIWTYGGGLYLNYADTGLFSSTTYGKSTKKIRLILRQVGTHWVWGGNYVHLQYMTMITKDMYLGYFLTHFSGQNGDENYFPWIYQWTNLNHYQLGPNTDVSVLDWQASYYNCKILIDVSHVFASTSFTGNSLNAQGQAAWNTYVAMVEESPGVTYASIAAFYSDEPYGAFGLTVGQVQTMASMIKSTFPNARVMVNMDYPSIDQMISIPSNVDWIAYDYYSANVSMVDYYRTRLESYTTQPLFIYIPAARNLEDYYYGGTMSDSAQASVAQTLYSRARSDPRVIGLLGFSVATQNPLSISYGILSNPYCNLTRQAHQNLGIKN